MISRRVLGVALSALAMCACSAMGGVITQTLPYSGTPDYSQVLTFNQFDDQGGTLSLDSVYVSVTLNANGGALRCDNDAATPASGAIVFGAEANVISSVSMINAMFQPIFQAGDVTATGGTTLNLAAEDGDVEVGGTEFFSYAGADYDFYTGGLAVGGDAGFVNSSVFAQYIGLGNFTVTMSANQVANYGSLGGVQAQIDPLIAGGVVTVIYNYSPEPATLGLLALTGLVAIRRRRAA